MPARTVAWCSLVMEKDRGLCDEDHLGIKKPPPSASQPPHPEARGRRKMLRCVHENSDLECEWVEGGDS